MGGKKVMKSISVLEFRKNAEKIIRWSQQGKRMVMTYRGRPAIRLEPIGDEIPTDEDPFLQLDGLVKSKEDSLSNKDMDTLIYEF